MDHNAKTLALVRKASTGNKESMAKLLRLTRPRLFAYLMRLTMDYHLTEDLLQDLQTDLVTSLWRLNKTDRFWPWIYKHAWGKVQHHYRDTRKHETIYLSDMEKTFFEEQFSSDKIRQDAFYSEIDKEKLFSTIYGAMKKIGLKPRNILTMRCFEEMSFHEISEFLGCSESNARVMFFRAKHQLKSRLRRKGFRANKMFLPALGLFGSITSKSASATTPSLVVVSNTSIEVGFFPALIGFLTTKLGVLLSTLCSALLAWFTMTNLFIIAVITILLIPLVMVLFMSYAIQCSSDS